LDEVTSVQSMSGWMKQHLFKACLVGWSNICSKHVWKAPPNIRQKVCTLRIATQTFNGQDRWV